MRVGLARHRPPPDPEICSRTIQAKHAVAGIPQVARVYSRVFHMNASFRISARPRSQACFECGGTGEIEGSLLGVVGLHPEGGEPILIPCLVCNGLGVVVSPVPDVPGSARIEPIRPPLAPGPTKPL